MALLLSITWALSFNTAASQDLTRQVSHRSKDSSPEGLTHQLVVVNRQYQTANIRQKGKLLSKLLKITAKREQLLADTVQNNAAEALRVALADSLSSTFPAQARDHIEKSVVLEGELEVVYEDYNQHGRLRYFLKIPNQRFSLYFKAHPPVLQTGAKVRVSGVKINDNVAVESGENDLAKLTSDLTTAPMTPTTMSLEVSNSFGVQNTAVLLVNFQDEATQPWTPAQTNDLVFNTINSFYFENSFQQTWLTGNVYGWYTIPVLSSECSQYVIGNAAKSAAAAAGVDLSQYSHLIYMFPNDSCFFWSGLSTVGGNPSESWINNDNSLRVVAHELGHGFGLFHSQGLDCTPGVLGTSCSTMAYGDTLDVMGGRAAHLNAYQKERLGWLNYGSSPPIKTANISGTYQVEPMESSGTSPKAIKILKSTDPVTGNRSWYYLEFRQALGFDSWMIGDAYLVEENVLNGVVVHTGTENKGDSSLMLDMTPDSPAIYGDLFDPALVAGQTYTDPEAGVTITTTSADANQAVVNVTIGQPSCVRANPTVTLSPSQSQWVSGGVPVIFSLTVTNNDSLSCGTANFSLSVNAPSGWTATFDNVAFDLAPGASNSTNLTVTSPLSAGDGFYNIVVNAKNNSNPTYIGSATATYVVSNQNPVAVDDSATTTQSQAVSIAVLSNDSDPAGRQLTVKSVTQAPNGKVSINANGTVTYAPNS
ncbi:MAG: hypothetical protein C5B54_08690, partial [Acidobacteria bacterium]